MEILICYIYKHFFIPDVNKIPVWNDTKKQLKATGQTLLRLP